MTYAFVGRGQLKCDGTVQKPDFVFRPNGRVHLNRRGRQFSRLLTAEVCASAVVMLDTTCSEVVWRVLATHSIRQFPHHFPSRASPFAITFQLESTHPEARMQNASRSSGLGCEDCRWQHILLPTGVPDGGIWNYVARERHGLFRINTKKWSMQNKQEDMGYFE